MPVSATESHYPLFLEGWSTRLATEYTRENYCYRTEKYGHSEAVVAEICGISPTKNHREKDPAAFADPDKTIPRYRDQGERAT